MSQIDRSEGLVGSTGIKAPVRAATTANITLSGEQTIDSIVCVEGDRVLVKNQTTGSENGIYTVSTGSWNRADDFDGSYDIVQGTLITVANGSANSNLIYQITTANPITIGTSLLTFAVNNTASISASGLHGATQKSVIVDADEGVMVDSADTWTLKKWTFTNLWTWIQSHLAAPGAIGGTTPAAGSFTTLTSTGGALNGTIGATTPNTIAASTITASGLITTTGGQIKFPSTQAPSADANTLDDYEENTFVPAISGTGTAGAGTYSVQLGKYTKIGNRIFFDIALVWSAHTGSGNTLITGLPFTSANDVTSSVCIGYETNFSLTASNVMIASIGLAAAYINIMQYPVGGGSFSAVALDTAASLYVSGSYAL